MTIQELQKAVVREAKNINRRLARLRAEDLPSTSFHKIQTAKNMKSPLITESGNISTSFKGMSESELKAKLKYIRGLAEDTETVKQARALVHQKAKEWKVSVETAKKRIRAGRIFDQVLDFRSFLYDSTHVHNAIQEFEHTPTFEQLDDKLMEMYGSEIQDIFEGRDILLEWMNEHDTIPPGVFAHYDDNGKIVYDED